MDQIIRRRDNWRVLVMCSPTTELNVCIELFTLVDICPLTSGQNGLTKNLRARLCVCVFAELMLAHD